MLMRSHFLYHYQKKLELQLPWNEKSLKINNYSFQIDTHFINQSLDNITAVKHGGTMQGCHLLRIDRVETDHFFRRLQFEHEPHNLQSSLRAREMYWSGQIELLRGNFGAWSQA